MTWQRFPLLRLFLAFCLGIVWQFFSPISLPILLRALVFLLSANVSLTLPYFKGISPRIRLVKGIIIYLSALWLGLAATYRHQEHSPLDRLTGQEKHLFTATINEEPQEKERSMALTVRLQHLHTPDTTLALQGQAVLFLAKSQAARKLAYGTTIQFRGPLAKPTPPVAPEQFDYPRYLRTKGVFYQKYLDSTAWLALPQPAVNDLRARAIRARQALVTRIDQWPLGSAQKGVVKALLLGYREDLSPELNQQYASAGITHVLAVSGLHVGILYLVASALLFWLKKLPYGEYGRLLLLALILWGYALLTGLSPSVVRAATMFSFVALGTSFGRLTSIYNTLLASAVVILAFRPAMLFSVGFQLSYLAVFAIVWLQPLLASYYQPRWWLLRKAWDITTVSVAAQIGTFPLAIYYFHQFPGLFLVANWLILPIIPFIMYGGGLCLLLDSLGIMPLWVVETLGYGLQFMNYTAAQIESMPGFIWQELHIPFWQMLAIYLGLSLFFLWLQGGRFRRIFLALVILVSLSAYEWYEERQSTRQCGCTFYPLRWDVLAICHQGSQGIWLSTASRERVLRAWPFLVESHLQQLNITDTLASEPAFKAGTWQIAGKKFALLSSAPADDLPQADYWWVHHKQEPPQPKNMLHLPEGLIVSQKDTAIRRRWEKWCIDAGVDYYAMEQQSARVTWALQ